MLPTGAAVQQQLLGLSVTPGSAASVVATAKGSAPIHQVQVMRPKQVQLRPTMQVLLLSILLNSSTCCQPGQCDL